MYDAWEDELEPLSAENIEDEVAHLYEDLLNWDYGHILTLGEEG